MNHPSSSGRLFLMLFRILLAMTLTLPLAAQQPYSLTHSIPAPPGGAQTGAMLGLAVATEGDYAVAGAPYDDTGGLDSGVVKVFDGTSGALLFVIPNPSPAANTRFGMAVALSGTRLVVASTRPIGPVSSSSPGTVHVFDLASGTPTVPIFTLSNPTLPSIPSFVPSDSFGQSVAISGTRIAVGASGTDTGANDSGSAYIYDLAGGTPTVPVLTLHNPGPAEGDYFGWSVAISASRVVVGAYKDDSGKVDSGAAYVYDLTSGTPTVPLHILKRPIPDVSDYFGWSVAITGARVVVGALQVEVVAPSAGSAYVFDLGSGTPTTPVFTLNNPEPALADHFGRSVSIHGTRMVVGSVSTNAGTLDPGTAYVFDVSTATPEVPVITLNNPSPAMNDTFGWSVAVSQTRIIVGAGGDDMGVTNAGTAYLYDLTSATPSVPSSLLNHPGPSSGDNFGYAVAISGTRMVVGARNDAVGAIGAGSVQVYDLASPTPTAPVLTLGNPAPSIDDAFGRSVSISGTWVVVGAASDSLSLQDPGTAYVYDLTSGTPTVPAFVLNNPDSGPNDFFGASVAVSGTWVVVGAGNDDTGAANAGSAYVYDLSSGTPTVPLFTLNNPSPAAGDAFGLSVAVSGTRVIVGAGNDDTGASDAGSAYIYDLTSTPTAPAFVLSNPQPATNDSFGRSVAISGTRAVVGAGNDDTGATDAGSAYVYDLTSGTPTVPLFTLNNPEPAVGDLFGSAVAISGTRAVVGTYQNDAGSLDAGSAYVYELGRGQSTVPVVAFHHPDPALGDGFGYAVAADGITVAIGAPFDDSPQFNRGQAHVWQDAVTQSPSLAAPAGNTRTTSPIHLSFSLPEDALTGSVKLTFGATQLTLATSQESAGAHSFSFSPANPIGSPQIASGNPIPDGTYTVQLTYQDTLGNPAAAASATNVTLDTVGPSGGSMTFSPASPVAISVPLTVTFAGWTDASPPLQYEVLFNDTIVSPPGTSTSRTLIAPTYPGTYTLKGRIHDALGQITQTTQTFTAYYTPEPRFENAMTTAGLTGNDAVPLATPQGDDVSNLLKYAFNLDLTAPDRRTLSPGGTAGLPSITRVGGLLRIEYLRRIGSGLIYTPQMRTGLDAGAWQPLTSLPVVTPVLNEPDWERAVHEEPFNPASTLRLYGRVEVTLP